MGLLNQILAGLGGSVLNRSPMGRAGGGTGRVVMALLPIVLGMLANRQGGGRGAVHGLDASSGLGGLGGMGGSTGGLGGAAGMGGLGALIEQFTQRGYGEQANSWVSTGPNQPIPPEAVADVFGQDRIAAIASQAGVSEDEARSGLSELLPEVVDHFTPAGEVSAPDQLLASIDDYTRQLPR